MQSYALEFPSESHPLFDIVVTAPGAELSESTLRSIAGRYRAKLQSLHIRSTQRAHLRLATACVYDLVIALEAVGLEVVRVVATSR